MQTDLRVVMFIDQINSTFRTHLRTQSEVEHINRVQEEITITVLRLTRGVVLKDTGDGCFSVFPSILSAVQAGMLLQRRVAERNQIQTLEHLRFELRIA